MAALTLADRLNPKRADEDMFERSIACPEDVVDALAPRMEQADQEELHALYLNTKSRVVAHRMVYRGNVNSSAVRPTEVYRTGVVCNLPGVVIAHNHPSGDPHPSNEDTALTRDPSEAGKLLGISSLDHVTIRSGQRWVSMKEQKLMGV